MDFVAFIINAIIVLIIFNLIRKKIFSRPDSRQTLFKEILKQWQQGLDPDQFPILRSGPSPDRTSPALTRGSRGPAEMAGLPEYAWPEEIEGTAGIEGTEGIEGSGNGEGMAGVEGSAGIEGTSGVEGSGDGEGAAGIEGTQGREGKWVIRETPGAVLTAPGEAASGFFAPDFKLDERELRQGVIWAEVLGRPRALRPFRSSR
jgi:hypothetical protein